MKANAAGLRIIDKFGEYCTVERAERAVERLVEFELNEDQFSAIVSFVTSIGVTDFRKSTLLMLLNKGQFLSTREWFDEYNCDASTGEIDKDLVARRRAEKRLFFKPQLVGGKDAQTIPA